MREKPIIIKSLASSNIYYLLFLIQHNESKDVRRTLLQMNDDREGTLIRANEIQVFKIFYITVKRLKILSSKKIVKIMVLITNDH